MSKLRVFTVLSVKEECTRAVNLRERPSIYLMDKLSILSLFVLKASFCKSKLWFSLKNICIISMSYWLIESLFRLQELWNVFIYGFWMIVTQLSVKLSRTSFRAFVKARSIYSRLIFCFHMGWCTLAVASFFITESGYTKCSITLFDSHQSVCMRDIRGRFRVILPGLHSTNVFQVWWLFLCCSLIWCVCSSLFDAFIKFNHRFCLVWIITHRHTCDICNIIWIISHLCQLFRRNFHFSAIVRLLDRRSVSVLQLSLHLVCFELWFAYPIWWTLHVDV